MRRRVAAFLLLWPGIAVAQTDSAGRAAPSPPAAPGPPLRRISSASAVSTEQLGSIVSVRELSDGRVLLNDGTRRRLLLMDTTLRTVRVVLDSLAEYANTYGVRPGALIPYRADSTLFIDPASLAMLVIDPAGEVARVRSVPRVQDVSRITSTQSYGLPGTEAKGRLVFSMYAQAAPPVKPPPRGVPYFPPEPDSVFVVAMNIDSRKLDTLGAMRIPKSGMTVRVSPTGGYNFIEQTNPLPSQDEFAVLADGSVAFVRSIDYRIDYLNPDGSWSSSPKLPYDWQPVNDSLKQRIVDSVRTAQNRTSRISYTTALIRWVNQYGKGYPPGFTAPDGFVPPQGFAKDWSFPPGVKFPANYIYACAPGVEPEMTPVTRGEAAAAAAAVPPLPPGPTPVNPGLPFGGGGRPSCIPAPIVNTSAPAPPTLRESGVLHPGELPDYRPPLAHGNAVRADADGNLWIRPIQPKPISGGPVYDVVSRSGEMIDRLQLPQGYSIVGFGKGRVVYLSMRDPSGLHLARVRLKDR